MAQPGLHDLRVHVERDVPSGPGATVGPWRQPDGTVPAFTELPDPTMLIWTGWRQLRA